jgi:tetratricopeptide (TPR) repeat protein
VWIAVRSFEAFAYWAPDGFSATTRAVYLYRIRIRPERAPEVSRVFEFSARHTLHDVHHAIQDAFELDNDHLHAFYLSGKHWDRDSEVSVEDAEGVRLFRLGLQPGRRFSYVFDFGDELWHELEVLAVSESETAPEEPLLLESVGEAPPQYEGDDEDVGEDGEADDEGDEGDEQDVTELVPLANELVRLFASDPDPNTDIGRKLLRSAYPLASDFARRLDADAERFWAVEEATDADLLELLLDLPLSLAHAGMTTEGGDLAQALAFIEPSSFLSDRALILADAGQREEALAQLKENLRSHGEDVWVEIGSGEVYAILGEFAEAEARFRAALERTPDEDARAAAHEQLVALLRAQRREAEASALEAAEHSREQRSGAGHAAEHGGAPTSAATRWLSPKVGRNDSCPCGSAKKYKKCCGASA